MMKFTCTLFLAAAVLAVSACSDPEPDPTTEGDGSHAVGHGAQSPTGGKLETDPIPYRAKGSKPSIDEPEFKQASDVTLPDGLNVIGVVINGEAKAYPTFILNQHQVVNDWLGGVPIAPSW